MFLRLFLITLLMSFLTACGGAASEGGDSSYDPRTFNLSANELACTEFKAYSQADQDHILSQGGVEGFCSQSEVLGTCQQSSYEYSYSYNTIYYKNSTNTNLAQSLKNACEQAQGSFTFADSDANTGGSSENVIERTYITLQDTIACTEQTSATLLGQNQIVSVGGVEGSCSLEGYLGICQQTAGGELSAINTVYYADEAGLRTADSLVPECEHIGGIFVYADNPTPPDTFAPILSEVTAIGTVSTYTPSYTFSSSEAGTISYIGACTSNNIIAVEGTNSVTFSVLEAGFYDNCRILVQDSSGNTSSELNVSGFTVNDISGPILSNVSNIGISYINNPVLTFTSSEAGTLGWGGSCSSKVVSIIEGVNRIELVSLNSGDYDDCSLRAYDNNTNPGESILIAPFTVIVFDTDGDGFTDFVEQEYGTDPLDEYSTTIGISSNTVDFTDDNDKDGFSDELEIWLNTDPNNSEDAPLDLDNNLIPDGFDSNSDILPPKILAFKMSETEIDIAEQTTISYSFTVVDNLSGLSDLSIELTSPSGQRNIKSIPPGLGKNVYDFHLTSSEFEPFSEAGVWVVKSVFLKDKARNWHFYTTEELNDFGFNTQILVKNDNSDVQAPLLENFSITQSNLDVSSGTAKLEYHLTTLDDISGLNNISIDIRSPSGQSNSISSRGYIGNHHTLVINGNAFGRYSEAGTWSVYAVALQDNADNYHYYHTSELEQLGFDTQVTIINQNSDTEAPVLENFSINVSQLNISSGNASFNYDLIASDNSSGISYIDIDLESPSGQMKSVFISYLGGKNYTLSRSSGIFGEFAETGIWKVKSVLMVDEANNYYNYTNTKLSELGFSSQIMITN